MRPPSLLYGVLALAGSAGLLGAQPITISGRIVDPRGAAAENVEVQLLTPLSSYTQARIELTGDAPRPTATARTEADGSFVILAPEAGFWRLVVAAPGAMPRAFHFLDEPLLGPTSVATLHLEEGSVTPVVVLDAALEPVAGAVVHATDEAGGPRGTPGSPWGLHPQQVTTDNEGRARVLRAGGSVLSVMAGRIGEVPATLTAGDGEPIELALGSGTTRRLRILEEDGRPAAEVILRVEGWAVAISDEEGQAEIRVPQGGGQLSAIAPDGRGAARRLAGEDGVTTPLEIELSAPRVVTGVVLDAVDLRPVAGAFVFPGSDLGRWTRSDQRGGFRVASHELERRLSAVARGYLRRSERLGEPGVPVTVRLARAVDLAGRVLDEAGEAIPGAAIRAAPELVGINPGWSGVPREATSDPLGNFVLPRLAAGGRYRVTAGKHGYTPAERLVRDSSEAAAAGGLDLVLERGSDAFGRVVDLQGVGVEGVSMTVESVQAAGGGSFRVASGGGPDLFTFETLSGADGAFSLSSVPPGSYAIHARAAGYARRTVLGIEIEPGLDSDLGIITLEPGVTLLGRVVDADGVPVGGARLAIFDRSGSSRFRAADEEPPVTTADDGAFEFEDRLEGEVVSLWVECDGFVSRDVPGVGVETGRAIEIVMNAGIAVRGRVLTPDGLPAAGARVEVTRESGGRSYRGRIRQDWLGALADELGRFEIANVEPGELRLAAEAPDWLRVEIGNLQAAPGEALEGLEITLGRGGRVEGRVIGPDGRPVPDAMVRAESPARRQGSSTHSNGNGDYALGGLPEGRQILSVGAFELGLSGSEEIVVEPGVNRLDFYLSRGVTVSGRVLTLRGVAVEDALIRIFPQGSFRGVQPSARSGKDGSFRIEDVAPGVHDIDVEHPDFVWVSPREPLEVADLPVLGLDVRMTRGSSIVGLLTGLDRATLAGTQIWAVRHRATFAEGTVASDGSYRIPRVAPGEWVVMAVTNDGRREQDSVDVADGVDEATLDLDFAEGLSLAGRVLTLGEPQTGLMVWVVGLDVRASASGSTDYEGRFKLRGLQAGTYTLNLSGHTTGLAHTETLEISRDDEITIELEPSTLRGTVVAADGGTPLGGVLIQLEPLGQGESRGSRFGQGVTTDDSGRFTLTDVAAGRHKLSVSRPGFATLSQVVETGDSGAVDDLEFELRRAGGIALRIRTHLGTPAVSVSWGVLDPAGRLLTGGTEQATSTGLVRLSTVPDGDWTVLLQATGAALRRLRVRAPSDERQVQLEAAARVTVRVEDLVEHPGRALLTIRDVTGQRFRSLGSGSSLRQEWGLFFGRVEVDDLPPGRWILTVTADDERRWEQAVTLDAGGQEIILDR